MKNLLPILLTLCSAAGFDLLLGRLAGQEEVASSHSAIAECQRLEATKPDLVFIGNSLLQHGVDPALFSELTGLDSEILWNGGAASAWWYLALKNIVLQLDEPPKDVVILFRNHMLTQPRFRTEAQYRTELVAMGAKEAPLVMEKAMASSLLDRWSSMHRARSDLKTRLKQFVTENLLTPLLSSNPRAIRRATQRTFAEKNMDAALLTKAAHRAERTRDPAAYDFEAALPNSFLPELIRITKQSGTDLHFIRFKSRDSSRVNKQQDILDQYIHNLETYLHSNAVHFLDFTEDPRLESHHYAKGDHLNQAGRTTFTRLLADALKNTAPSASKDTSAPESR